MQTETIEAPSTRITIAGDSSNGFKSPTNTRVDASYVGIQLPSADTDQDNRKHNLHQISQMVMISDCQKVEARKLG